ncbi:hypothetical protein L288_01100 [Sphingobium quisquiliarum P25]|uniref:Uncharacterized protein n=1 Tax=Sphingobium quisquiliarum P25 TaxID=1329909 RepID=T0HEK0_9SPHN|nr:hypothetical protein [Sphingobium quisquiliarum]EQB14781.1 hypothetical protein L288_01100 [Sphingobium quisquiliarum P25]
MADLRAKRKSCLFVIAILLGLILLIGVIIYTSDRAPDPASRPPRGAMPPQGEPMRPASAEANGPEPDG